MVPILRICVPSYQLMNMHVNCFVLILILVREILSGRNGYAQPFNADSKQTQDGLNQALSKLIKSEDCYHSNTTYRIMVEVLTHRSQAW